MDPRFIVLCFAITYGVKANILEVTHGTVLQIRCKNEGYIGCYRDKKDQMFTGKVQKQIADITLEKCREICSEFTFLGLQYGNECFCSNKMDTDTWIMVPENECNKKCTGEDRKCGDGNRNSVYLVNPR